MQASLQHSPVHFTGEQARLVARGCKCPQYAIHACAVLPEHVHLVVAHDTRNVRRMVGHLKSEATRSLPEAGWFLDHTPWADHGWNVYLDSRDAMRRAIRDIENNPLREGKRRQYWSCVVPYDETADRAARCGIII